MSAFLAFAVQPMMGKLILPRLGGTPAVWTTTLMFFQVLLLAGYLYSHVLVKLFKPRVQGAVHLLVLATSAALLVMSGEILSGEIPSQNWGGPEDLGSPTISVLSVLALGVGAPFWVLTTTTSLLQSWSHKVAGDELPYRYYALSNAGSLLALVAYPFVIEIFFPLSLQTVLWTWGYVLFAIACGVQSLRTLLSAPAPTGSSHANLDTNVPRPAVHRQVLWICLPACASMALLATGNLMTQDVAAVPALWILPLVLYLLSFIFSFAQRNLYNRWWVFAFFAATLLHAPLLLFRNDIHICLQTTGFCFVLFAACMVCHGELARIKPAPIFLTRFYLLVSLGGALGGVFTVLAAPVLFDDFHEFPLSLGLTWVFLFAVWLKDRKSPLLKKRTMRPVSLACAVAIATTAFVTMFNVQSTKATMLESGRNFFGTYWVTRSAPSDGSVALNLLGHGITIHGSQLTEGFLKRAPTAYYGPSSGVGIALLHLRERAENRKIGVIGLGVGTLATYGKEDDTFVFYEINPDIIRLAKGDGGYFSFLKDSPAKVEIVQGDGRISLEKEASSGNLREFDLLVLDAFSSHSIPVHLLTLECFEMYLRHLKDDGLIAVHIGNPHIDLRPVVAAVAGSLALHTTLVESRGNGHMLHDSVWILMSRNKAFFENPKIANRSSPLPNTNMHPWTDDHTNLLGLMF